MDFRTIAPRKSPNRYLVAPKDYASLAPHALAPVWPVPVAKLRDALTTMLAREPRTRIVADDDRGFDITVRSRLFGFVDDVAVAFLSVDAGHATLAIYSRSRVGYSDLGANRRRVRRWLAAVTSALGVAPRAGA